MERRNHIGCPACNGKRFEKTEVVGVFKCRRCEAIYGECYLGESYELVSPYMTENAEGEERYYDLICLGSKGITRRHGWYDTITKRSTQVG